MRLSLNVLLAGLSTAAMAQVPQSAPQPQPLPPAIAAPRDVAYPGTIRLNVDATDTDRGIFRVVETIPVAVAGRMTLRYPQWLPGSHAPRGPIDDIAGLTVDAGGRTLAWVRDPVDVFAIHVDVPAGATEVTLHFDYLSPTKEDQGRVVMTPEMLNLQWNLTAFYPAGYYVRQIPVAATAKLPVGWKWAAALDALPGTDPAAVSFKPVSFETLVDSPMFAGRYYRREPLSPDVTLNIFADSADELAATPDQIAKHRALVEQATRLFGAQHYDRYDFLLAITNRMGKIGLEHHRSSEDGTGLGYFTKWDDKASARNLLPHEYTHSWNGKYRRGADLFTPDYAMPMRNSLLWVYEGQTQFWGYVLQARSGMVSTQDTIDALAMTAATLDTRPGRQWRPVIDTTNDPIMAARRPQPWVSEQRSEDYYAEGMLVWLDVDAKLRALSGGTRSMDDFARAFFGRNDRDWGVSTYSVADVAATLNGIAPYDWAGYLDARIDRIAPHAPLDWVAAAGYRLSYAPEPTAYWKGVEKDRKVTDLSYSLGLTIDKDNAASGVIWGGPAFDAGITIGTTLLAIDGQAFTPDALKAAIKVAQGGTRPIVLLAKTGDRYRTLSIAYHGGPRYPRLEKIGKGDGGLDRLLRARK